MKIDPSHLQIIAAVIDAGGLGEGARALNKSQPSVSRTLSMLESRLGSRLFEKGKRPLRPTELCRGLAVQGRLIAEASEAASQAVALYSGGKSGTARIAGTPIFMDGVVSSMMAAFQKNFPEVTIDQSYGYVDSLVEQLKVGNIDLAICPINTEQVPEGLTFKSILTGRNVIACSPKHPLANKSSLKLTDIAAYPWIAPPVGSPLNDDLQNTLYAIGIKNFRVSFTGGSLVSILNVLAGAEALTVMPYSVVFMQQHYKTVTALPIRIDHPDRQLGLLWCEDRSVRPAVKRFRDFIELEFRGMAKRIVEMEQSALWRR